MSDAAFVQNVLAHRSDYYAVLGVARDASEAQIKRAFKKAALRCHPDKNSHAKAAEAFKVLNTAHSVLTDAAKRRAYDIYGEEGAQAAEAADSAPAGSRSAAGRQSASRQSGGAPNFRTEFREFRTGGDGPATFVFEQHSGPGFSFTRRSTGTGGAPAGGAAGHAGASARHTTGGAAAGMDADFEELFNFADMFGPAAGFGAQRTGAAGGTSRARGFPSAFGGDFAAPFPSAFSRGGAGANGAFPSAFGKDFADLDDFAARMFGPSADIFGPGFGRQTTTRGARR